MNESFSAHRPLTADVTISLVELEWTFLSNPFVCVHWRLFCTSSYQVRVQVCVV